MTGRRTAVSAAAARATRASSPSEVRPSVTSAIRESSGKCAASAGIASRTAARFVAPAAGKIGDGLFERFEATVTRRFDEDVKRQQPHTADVVAALVEQPQKLDDAPIVSACGAARNVPQQHEARPGSERRRVAADSHRSRRIPEPIFRRPRRDRRLVGDVALHSHLRLEVRLDCARVPCRSPAAQIEALGVDALRFRVGSDLDVANRRSVSEVEHVRPRRQLLVVGDANGFRPMRLDGIDGETKGGAGAPLRERRVGAAMHDLVVRGAGLHSLDRHALDRHAVPQSAVEVEPEIADFSVGGKRKGEVAADDFIEVIALGQFEDRACQVAADDRAHFDAGGGQRGAAFFIDHGERRRHPRRAGSSHLAAPRRWGEVTRTRSAMTNERRMATSCDRWSLQRPCHGVRRGGALLESRRVRNVVVPVQSDGGRCEAMNTSE